MGHHYLALDGNYGLKSAFMSRARTEKSFGLRPNWFAHLFNHALNTNMIHAGECERTAAASSPVIWPGDMRGAIAIIRCRVDRWLAATMQCSSADMPMILRVNLSHRQCTLCKWLVNSQPVFLCWSFIFDFQFPFHFICMVMTLHFHSLLHALRIEPHENHTHPLSYDAE